ncbi:MAG TPA: glycosyltransferase [Allosphingosinicella sp.]|nr:glycosyltransferase [Allosphingosinicella sp.]
MSTAAALARQGIEVTLILPRGTGDPVLSADDLRAWFAVRGEFRVVQRQGAWAGESLARQLLWLREVFRDPLLGEADLLYARIPALLGVGARAPLPFAIDHYRPWPDDWPAIRPLVRRTARSSKCLGLVLHSHYAAAAYRRAGVPEAKILVAHNGADPVADAPHAPVDLPRGRPIALYAGRINREKGLDQILAMAALRPQVLFVLVGSEGDGPIEAEAAGLANVRIVPWQAPVDLPAWLAAADLLLIPPSRSPLETFRNCVLPLKLFAYLAAGRPILAPQSPDTAELLSDGHNALLVPPGRPDLAAEALDRLLGDASLAERLASAARADALALTWDKRAERILAFLKERLSRP